MKSTLKHSYRYVKKYAEVTYTLMQIWNYAYSSWMYNLSHKILKPQNNILTTDSKEYSQYYHLEELWGKEGKQKVHCLNLSVHKQAER